MANPVEIVPAGSSTAVSSSNPLPVSSVGGVAAGAVDSGNPVKIGGVFTTTPPTATSGNRTDIQTNNRGAVHTVLTQDGGTTTASVTSSAAGDAFAGGNTLAVMGQNRKWNGASWDRDRKSNATSRIPSAAASTNATSAKASAGDLHCISGYNAAATVRYIKFYAKATAPTVGTDVPVITLALPPTSAFNINMNGHYIATGIAYAMTTGAADADTGALTAADVVGLTITYA